MNHQSARFIRMQDVKKKIGVSRSTLYDWINPKEGANKQAISSWQARQLNFCVSGPIISPTNSSNQPV